MSSAAGKQKGVHIKCNSSQFGHPISVKSMFAHHYVSSQYKGYSTKVPLSPSSKVQCPSKKPGSILTQTQKMQKKSEESQKRKTGQELNSVSHTKLTPEEILKLGVKGRNKDPRRGNEKCKSKNKTSRQHLNTGVQELSSTLGDSKKTVVSSRADSTKAVPHNTSKPLLCEMNEEKQASASSKKAPSVTTRSTQSSGSTKSQSKKEVINGLKGEEREMKINEIGLILSCYLSKREAVDSGKKKSKISQQHSPERGTSKILIEKEVAPKKGIKDQGGNNMQQLKGRLKNLTTEMNMGQKGPAHHLRNCSETEKRAKELEKNIKACLSLSVKEPGDLEQEVKDTAFPPSIRSHTIDLHENKSRQIKEQLSTLKERIKTVLNNGSKSIKILKAKLKEAKF